MALRNETISSKIVGEAKRKLNLLGTRCSITLVWTKAHVGTEGNERADCLAKEGGNSGDLYDIGLPGTVIKAEIRAYFYDKWKEEWELYEGARMSKIFFNGPDKIKSKIICRLSSYKVGRLVRILSGHNRLNYGFCGSRFPWASPCCR